MSHVFDQIAFNQFILKNHVIGFFDKPITLKSGRQSNWYVNWRDAASDAYSLDVLTDFIVSFVTSQKLNADCIYGVPEGATKAAILASLKLAKKSPNFGLGSHCIPMGRAKPKEHGNPKDRYFIGEPRGRTIILEDVTTTGGSLIATIDKLLEVQIEIVAALSLTNRKESRDDGLSVEEYFKKNYEGKIPFLAMSEAPELLKCLKP